MSCIVPVEGREKVFELRFIALKVGERLRPEGRLAILDVQQFHGGLRIFNPILSGQVDPYGVEYATCKDAMKCMGITRGLLKEVEVEEGYLGMLYIASGAKR